MESENPIIPATPPVRERLQFLNIPIDSISPELVRDIIYDLLNAKEGKNIVLLSVWDLLHARRNTAYRDFILNASLVIPISKSLIDGIQFLTGKQTIRYMPFDFVITLLTLLEAREFSLYLLGGKLRTLRKTEKNLKQTFPRLHIVGRNAGPFKKTEEPAILKNIEKTAPTLLLVGKGVAGEEHWIARNDKALPKGLRMWCSDIYDIFAELKNHPSRYTFDHGLEWISLFWENPLRLFRIFPYAHYKLLLLFYKLFKSKKKKKPLSL